MTIVQRHRPARILGGLKTRSQAALARARLDLLTLTEALVPARAAGLPLPPPRLRQKVANGRFGVREHLDMGREVSELIQRELAEAGYDFAGFGHVLDFGCGCARVLRHLYAGEGKPRLHGTDIDEELIGWARSNLSHIADWTVNPYQPPTAYPSGHFDFIYAISVFTHIDEPAQKMWLTEFRRILKPDGVLLLTVLPAGDSQANRVDYVNPKGMYFRYRKTDLVKRSWLGEKVDHPFYIDAFHSKEYIYAEWQEDFEIVRYSERALGGRQDAVLLRVRPDER